ACNMMSFLKCRPVNFILVRSVSNQLRQLGNVFCLNSPELQQSRYQAAKEALTSKQRPEVLLCMSDRIALAALQAARHLNLRVPEDVKITGFDDIPESHTQHPTLTTVHQQSKDKGTVAAEIFLGMREEKSIVIPTELMIRESCP
ncbi:substrate-binding domain-containing protein, partial [Pseudomaricurvus alkylphenolicus]|uniref:substrate-binding domain-containing protein n=1 Tax=Pseudomaricurvus alkylphenolicus TaxID=1306991 RepID=UPI00142482E9